MWGAVDVSREAVVGDNVLAGACVVDVDCEAIDGCCNVVDGCRETVGEGCEAVDASPSVSFVRTEVSELGSG